MTLEEIKARVTPGYLGLSSEDAAWLVAEVERLRAENAEPRKTAPRKGRTILVLNTDNVAAVQRAVKALAAAGLMEVSNAK